MTTQTQKLADEFNRYFTSANDVDMPARISVSRDEWRELYAAIREALTPDAWWAHGPRGSTIIMDKSRIEANIKALAMAVDDDPSDYTITAMKMIPKIADVTGF